MLSVFWGIRQQAIGTGQQTGGRDPQNGGRWRLFDSLVRYAEPLVPYSWHEVLEEYPESDSPFTEYLKHMCRRYEGEIALAWGEWVWSPRPLPRNKVLWHPQYARKSAKPLVDVTRRTSDQMIPQDISLLAVGNTMILRPNSSASDDGHWHRRGGAITLAELLMNFGQNHTFEELMFWYYHSPKLVKKRLHAWGSKERREAAQMRKVVFGRYGFSKWHTASWQ